MASSTMRLERQCGTKSSLGLESGGGDGVEHAVEGEPHDAAAHRSEPRSEEAAEDTARHAGRPGASTEATAMARGASH